MYDRFPPLPIIFVSSPLAPQPGDPGWPADANPGVYNERDLGTFSQLALDANKDFVRAISRRIRMAGGAPFPPHLLLPQFLADDNESERAMGISAGVSVLSRADEAWNILPPWRQKFSRGMTEESGIAKRIGVPTFTAENEDAFAALLERLKRGDVKLRFPAVIVSRKGDVSTLPPA